MRLMRVLGILAMCCAAIWSLVLGVEDIATAKLLVTAMRLESPGFSDDLNAEQTLSTCRSSIVHASVATLFAQMDRQRALDNNAAWLTARKRAGEMIDHAVACLPSDGDMWGRAAQLSEANADWSNMLSRLALSQRLAPAEDAVLRTRIDIWASAPVSLAEGADGSLRADIRIVLEHGRIELVRLLLASVPAWTLSVMRDEVAGLSQTRRELAERLVPALTTDVAEGAI